jgi:hypothetical protein
VGLVSGRIVLNGSRGVNYSTASGPADRQEQLQIRMNGSDPNIQYDLSTPTEQISIAFQSATRLTIRRGPRDEAKDSKAVRVEFNQPGTGMEPVTLKVGPKGEERIYQAASIWHLMIQQPQPCREHLLPLLKNLQRDWEVGKLAAEIEEGLMQTAAGPDPDQQRWAEWVRQLGDDRFSVREAADRKLRETGRVVITYLQQIDPQKLDVEQQYRVRRIISALSDTGGDDSPEQVAAWLSGDPSIWVAMLSRDDEKTRRVAARRVESLLGRSILFDPAADLPTRARQIEQVRVQLSAK